MLFLKDLRYGSILSFNNGPVTVTGVDNSGVNGPMITIGYGAHAMSLPMDLFKPIELTSHLLISSGFKYVDSSEFRINDFYIVRRNNLFFPCKAVGMPIGKEIKHLHQLQSLYFDLTETELPIKL